jgi:hypothetical protein
LLPLRLLRNRDRSGAYLIMLCLGTASFGMYFFLTLFMQGIWGYSALRTGLVYLPYTAVVVVVTGAATQLVPRIGARPLLLAGSAVSVGGLYWQSQITDHSTYLGAVLGPMLVNATGMGLLFVPLSLVALSKVRAQESGVASSVLNAGLQVGGSIGLAVLGTVAWTVVANNIRAQAALTAAAAARAGHAARPSQAALTAAYHHALADGFARGFLIAAGIMLLALAITIVAIRVQRTSLAGATDPVPAPPQPAAASPAAVGTPSSTDTPAGQADRPAPLARPARSSP